MLIRLSALVVTCLVLSGLVSACIPRHPPHTPQPPPEVPGQEVRSAGHERP
jgi:hypothetical protein